MAGASSRVRCSSFVCQRAPKDPPTIPPMTPPAETPAFAHELPELDHNEIVGWEAAPALGRFSAVFLDDCDLHPRARERIALTRELIEPSAAATFVVETRGETRTDERRHKRGAHGARLCPECRGRRPRREGAHRQ